MHGSSRIFLTKSVRHEAQTDNTGIGIVPIHVNQPDNSMTRFTPYHTHLAALKRRWNSSVPPLGAFCIARLVGSTLENSSEWLPSMPNLQLPKSFSEDINGGVSRFEDDLLNALADAKECSFSNSSTYSPDIWLKLVMFFTKCLPLSFRMKSLPLSDIHIPIIQLVDPSPRFTVISVLSLRNRQSVLDDSNIGQLKDLHQLVSLDLSFTAISSVGIHTLSRTLRQQGSESESNRLLGPWKIRLLYLEGCPSIDNRACEHLAKWPLLCFVDFRGTSCSKAHISGWRNLRKEKFDLFIPSLVYPNHPLYALQVLHERFPALFPSHDDFPYTLYVDQLDHPAFKHSERANSVISDSVAFHLRRRAGAAQDSDLAIFPANLRRKVVVRRAPLQEEDQESVVRVRTKDSDLRALGSNQFFAAQHRQRWRRAMYEDDDDIFGGRSAHSSDDETASQGEHTQDEDFVLPNPNITPTSANERRAAHSTHMQHTLTIFFSKLRDPSSKSRKLDSSLEDLALPTVNMNNPGHPTRVPIQIPARALHLLAVREPPPFEETLSLVQGRSSSSLDEAKRRQQTVQILAGEAPAQLRKRKSVDDGCNEARRPPTGVRPGAALVYAQPPNEPGGARDGFWKDMQAKRRRRIESSSPLSRQGQGPQTKGATIPTSALGPNASNGPVSSLRPARRTPFGFAAKKTK